MRPKLILSFVLLSLFCSGQTGKDRFVRVYFPDGFAVTAELAVNAEERARGLMFRDKMHENQAMLFVFEEEDIHSFWMKNMRFAIDILWLDRDKTIVHIETRVPPCRRDPCPSYTPSRAAVYVLELQAGSAEGHGLREFDRLEFILPKGFSGFQNPQH